MKSNKRLPTVIEKGPDLKIPPHVFPQLMDLFFDEKQQVNFQEEQLLAHLTVCHYCRMALKTLLIIVRDYDHKNEPFNQVSQELLERFIQIDDELDTLEAHRLEHLAAYTEVVVEHGEIEAIIRFPDVAAHLE